MRCRFVLAASLAVSRGRRYLVTHLGMVRSNAYYAAGCPLELCDHAAARDLWRVIYRDAIASDAERAKEDVCR